MSDSEVPAGLARVRYEAGSIEPLYANDEFFNLLGYRRRGADERYPFDVQKSRGWRDFCEQLRTHIEAGIDKFEIEVKQETATARCFGRWRGAGTMRSAESSRASCWTSARGWTPPSACV